MVLVNGYTSDSKHEKIEENETKNSLKHFEKKDQRVLSVKPELG